MEFGWGQMKNKNGNKVIGAIKRSNGIKGVNGGTGAKGLNGSHVNGSHPGNGAAAGADKKNYRPTEKEPFMNERQRDYFRERLLAWREDILKEAKETLQHLQDENQNHPDLADRASSETDRAIELRARDRQRKVINKIDAALRAHRGRHLRLLRGDRRADRAQAPRGAPDRHAVGRGAGASRAPRARLPRRLSRASVPGPVTIADIQRESLPAVLPGYQKPLGEHPGTGCPYSERRSVRSARVAVREPDFEGRAIRGH